MGSAPSSPAPTPSPDMSGKILKVAVGEESPRAPRGGPRLCALQTSTACVEHARSRTTRLHARAFPHAPSPFPSRFRVLWPLRVLPQVHNPAVRLGPLSQRALKRSSFARTGGSFARTGLRVPPQRRSFASSLSPLQECYQGAAALCDGDRRHRTPLQRKFARPPRKASAHSTLTAQPPYTNPSQAVRGHRRRGRGRQGGVLQAEVGRLPRLSGAGQAAGGLCVSAARRRRRAQSAALQKGL